MPNTKSAKKQIRKDTHRRALNRSKLSALRTCEKKFRATLESGDIDAARTLLGQVSKHYDKAAKTNLVHSNQADRKKARLHHRLQAAEAK